jgi:hypothetical protein
VASSKSKHPETLGTIAEIESKGEQILEWATENARVVLGVAGACLLVAGIYQYTQSAADKREHSASAALEAIRSDYLAAMGALPGALTVPELANPAAGERIRSDYRGRFAAIAEEHRGSSAAALASLAEGDIAADGGDVAAALGIWQAASGALPAGSAIHGLLQQRIAHTLEETGDWGAAAEAYAAAAAVKAYTFRHWAMAEAARCFLAADQPERARELAQRIDAEAPDLQLPDSLRTQLRELGTGGSS